MAWFVTYELQVRSTMERKDPSNVILLNTHPLEWASKHNKFYVTYLLFFKEIDESTITENVKKWTTVEN